MLQLGVKPVLHPKTHLVKAPIMLFITLHGMIWFSHGDEIYIGRLCSCCVKIQAFDEKGQYKI